MIAIGTKGITNEFDKQIGNISQKVKNIAECPVWVDPEKVSLIYPKAIFYAADLIGEEEEAVKKLLAIAKPLDANCDVVHIHENFEMNICHQIETM